MLRYVGGRLIQAVPVLVLATIVVFGLLRLLPGDPAEVLAGDNAPPQVVAAVRHEFGLDQPLPIQYWTWLTHVLRGDLGNSVRTNSPVFDSIEARVPASLELAASAIVLTVLIAIPLGALAAVYNGRRLDWLISLFNGVSLSVPNFWLGILAASWTSPLIRWAACGLSHCRH